MPMVFVWQMYANLSLRMTAAMMPMWCGGVQKAQSEPKTSALS